MHLGGPEIALSFWPKNGYLPAETGVFSSPVQTVQEVQAVLARCPLLLTQRAPRNMKEKCQIEALFGFFLQAKGRCSL